MKANKNWTRPTVDAPAPPIEHSSLLAEQRTFLSDMLDVTNALESLTSTLCGSYPVPQTKVEGTENGVFGEMRELSRMKRELLERISTATSMIRSAV